MRRLAYGFLLAAFAHSGVLLAQSASSHRYPPLREYLMTQEAEMALARSAAPPSVTAGATIKVLTQSGYQVVRKGETL